MRGQKTPLSKSRHELIFVIHMVRSKLEKITDGIVGEVTAVNMDVSADWYAEGDCMEEGWMIRWLALGQYICHHSC